MAILKNAKTLTAVALAATAFATLPSVASAADYRCEKKNDEAQIVGGVIGAVVGGLIGSEVAGPGDGNEGAVIGALLGAGAGAALGDESVKCRGKNDRIRHTTHYQNRNNGYQPAVVTVGHPRHNSRQRDYGYNNRHYNNNRGFNRIDRINYRLDALRAELRDLKRQNRYDHRRWIDRRIRAIGHEIGELKQRKRRIKNRNYDRGYSYGHNNRRGHYHGNSRTLCYSGH